MEFYTNKELEAIQKAVVSGKYISEDVKKRLLTVLDEARGGAVSMDFADSKNWKQELKSKLQTSKHIVAEFEGYKVADIVSTSRGYNLYDTEGDEYLVQGGSLKDLISEIEEWLEGMM